MKISLMARFMRIFAILSFAIVLQSNCFAMKKLSNKQFKAFEKDPCAYLEKDIRQQNMKLFLEQIKTQRYDDFKKICYENRYGEKKQTFLIRAAELLLWDVGIFLAQNAPRDENKRLLVNLDIQDITQNTALHYFCKIFPVSHASFMLKTDTQKKAASMGIVRGNKAEAGDGNQKILLKYLYKNRTDAYKWDVDSIAGGEDEIEGAHISWNRLAVPAEELISAGASLEIKNGNGDAPIHLCAKYGSSVLFDYLFDGSVDNNLQKKLADLQDGSGNSTYHLYIWRAVTFSPGRIKTIPKNVLTFFTRIGADKTLKNNSGETPEDSIRLLVKREEINSLVAESILNGNKEASKKLSTPYYSKLYLPVCLSVAAICGIAFLWYRFASK